MGPLVSVFILILVVSILAGLTFLFIASLKTQAATQSPTSDSISVVNESLSAVTEAGANSAVYDYRSAACGSVSGVLNATGNTELLAGNYTQTNCNIKFSGSAADALKYNNTAWRITYSYTYVPTTTSENAINSTETSGYTIIGYLPLIFLAIIFGALLTLVLKIILPYINLGQQTGGF